MSKIEVTVTDEAKEQRLALQFKQGKATWEMFLYDNVRFNTLLMKPWLKNLVEEIQKKV